VSECIQGPNCKGIEHGWECPLADPVGDIARIVGLCPFCNRHVARDHPETWKQVVGWVGGPRKDSMRLREDTGRYAHNHCVEKAQIGQAPDQPSLLDDEPTPVPQEGISGGDSESLRGLFDD
jgi:hypothetical protein